jgi:hypothetical protein
MLTVAAVAALAAPLTMMQPAGATAPDLACGNTQPGPCSETAHFTDIDDLNTPAPPGGGCPAYLATDFFSFVGTGDGVEHAHANKAGNGGFRTTFTGNVTITAYLNGTVDEDGNVTSVSDPDPNVLPFSGRITQSFGGSFNKQSGTFQAVINLSLTNANGDHLRVHFLSHQTFAPGSEEPHTDFTRIHCF